MMLKALVLSVLFSNYAFSVTVEERLAKLEKIVALQHSQWSSNAYYFENNETSQLLSIDSEVNLRKIKVDKAGKYYVTFNASFFAPQNQSTRGLNGKIYLNEGQPPLGVITSNFTDKGSSPDGTGAQYSSVAPSIIVDLKKDDVLRFVVSASSGNCELHRYSVSIVPLPKDSQANMGTVVN